MQHSLIYPIQIIEATAKLNVAWREFKLFKPKMNKVGRRIQIIEIKDEQSGEENSNS